MKRALQYATATAFAVFAAVAASGARTPAFAADTRPCYNGTPQECWRNETCTMFGYSINSWPPSVTTTCLAKSVEIYYWSPTATSTGTSGGTAPKPSTQLK
jgi:hypothetical protein